MLKFKSMWFVSALTISCGFGCARSDAPVVTDAAVVATLPETGTPKAAAPSGEPAATGSCTWETPLEPGIPGSPGHYIPSPINPNGQSELAALMRDIQTHMKEARAAIAAGQPLPVLPANHAKLRCAWPTTASDRNAAYDAFAVSYHAAVDALHAAKTPEDQRARYGEVLTTCRTCHENSCPGPIMAIDALSFDRLETP